jgi:photosystem II stability/assembly factor-like uncharacterized protein
MKPRTSLLAVFALGISIITWSLAFIGAESSKGDFDAHLKAWNDHRAMAQSSPYKGLSWSYLGPTNVAGRVADMAVAEKNGQRRIYVATCCGGVWKTDNLGQTYEVVFDQGASSSVGDIAVAPSNPDIVWIGTGESNIFRSSYAGAGVYKSIDAGKTWAHMGLIDTGTIGRILIDPANPNVVYVASAGHEWTENDTRGVFKTTDGGKSWSKALWISRKTGVNDLVMDPSDANTLYAAAWERQRRHFNDPKNEPGFNESGIFKTTDAGKTWTRLTNGLPPAAVTGRVGIDVASSNPNVVYAFIDNYDKGDKAPPKTLDPYGNLVEYYPIGNQVYRSNDKGVSWKLVSGQDPEGVDQSGRGSQHMVMRNLSSSYGWVFGNIRVDPTDENKVYVLALGVSMSTDGGKTFGPIIPPPPPTAGAAGARGAGGGGRGPGGDNHAYWIDPKDPKFMLSGNDSGFRITTDGGQTWNHAPLPTSTWFDMAYDMDTPFHVVGSVQDHGSYRLTVDLKNGRSNLAAIPAEGGMPGGEGSQHAIDPTNPNIVYGIGSYGNIVRSDLSVAAGDRRGGGGANAAAGGGAATAVAGGQGAGRGAAQRSTRIRPSDPPEGPLRAQWLAGLALSPWDPNTVYFGSQFLYRSHDRGDHWEKLTGDLSGGDPKQLGGVPYQTIVTIAESPKKKGVVYAGTDDGHLHMTMDDGKTWTDLTSKLPQRKWIAKVLPSQYDEATVYVAQQGRYEDDFTVYLYKSTNYGKTWKSIAGNLPGGPMNMIREDPAKPNILYTCNDVGVYVTTNGGRKWDVLGGNFPSVQVMDFIVHPRDHVLVTATHGRGVWVVDVSGIEK